MNATEFSNKENKNSRLQYDKNSKLRRKHDIKWEIKQVKTHVLKHPWQWTHNNWTDLLFKGNLWLQKWFLFWFLEIQLMEGKYTSKRTICFNVRNKRMEKSIADQRKKAHPCYSQTWKLRHSKKCKHHRKRDTRQNSSELYNSSQSSKLM